MLGRFCLHVCADQALQTRCRGDTEQHMVALSHKKLHHMAQHVWISYWEPWPLCLRRFATRRPCDRLARLVTGSLSHTFDGIRINSQRPIFFHIKKRRPRVGPLLKAP
jgi:hypothetical protein